MTRPVFRRLLATPVAALLLAGLAVPVAAPASAAQGAVAPFNIDSSSGDVRLTYTADSDDDRFPTGPNMVVVEVTRSADATDAMTVSDPSSPVTVPPSATSPTVSFTVDTTRANPGLYNVRIYDSTPQANLLADCDQCVSVGLQKPVCSSASRSGTVVTVRGSTFPKTTTLGFLKPGVTAPGTRADDDAAFTAVYDTDDIDGTALDTATSIPYVVTSSADAIAGTHRLVLRTTDGAAAVCPQLFTVPKGSLRADDVPARTPAHLGNGARAVRFTATGSGFLPGSTVSVALTASAGELDTNGVTATPTAIDGTGLRLSLSASTDATTSARTVTYNAPDLGFYVDKTGLLVQDPPGVDSPGTPNVNVPPAPATLGQGARNVPVDIRVPAGQDAPRAFSYDGAGLVASLGQVPGLNVTFKSFLSGSTEVAANPNSRYTAARLLVSTVEVSSTGAKRRAPTGTYTMETRNADGGQSPLASSESENGDGSCYLCFTVAAGPVITSLSTSTLTPGGGPTTVVITGTGFKPVPFLTGPAASVIVLPDLNGDGNSDEWGVAYNSRSATSISVNITPPVGAASQAVTLGVRNPTDQGFDDCVGCLTIGGLSVNPPVPSFARNDDTYEIEVTGGPFSTDLAKTQIFLERNGVATLPGTITTLESGRIRATFPFQFASPSPVDGYSVRVVSDGLVGRRQNSFQVRSLRPRLSSLTPTQAAPGAVIDVDVVGDYFAEGSTLQFIDAAESTGEIDPRVTASPNLQKITDRTKMTVTVRVDSSAVPGTLYDVYAVNTDGQQSPDTDTGVIATQFLIVPGAVATTFSPMSRDAGAPVFTGTLNGSGYSDVESMEFSGGGITATEVTTAGDGSSVTAKITIAPEAATGSRDVTVVNGDGQEITCEGCFSVTAAPTVTTISPAFVQTTTTPVDRTFTLDGEGFGNNDTVSLGDGITVNSVTYSPTAGTLSVAARVEAGATRGLRTVKVTNTDQNGAGSGTCPGCLTVAALPGDPTGLTATPGDGKVSLSWTAPVDDGGAPLGSYVVSVAAEQGQPTGTVTVSGTTAEVTGLANGKPYGFVVRSRNEIGQSAPGASTSATPNPPATAPGKPTGVTATAGNASATVSWTAPASNGGSALTGYTVTASPGGATQSVSGNPPATSLVFNGLTNGTPYTFTVKATNAVGSSDASDPSSPVTPQAPSDGKPGAPGTPTATVDRAPGTADLSWAAPTTGTAPTQYRVEVSPAAGTVTYPTDRTTRTAVVTGLANGTSYTFKVYGTASGGEGPASAASAAVVPYDVPGAPTGLAATGADGTLDVTWTAPAANGRPITSYTLVLSPADGTITYPTDRSQTGAKVTGLTQGRTYSASVVATNARGSGAAGTATLQSPRLVADSKYVALSAPVRVADTRRSDTGVTAGRKQGAVTLDLSSRIPGNATGALLNVTVTGPTAPGFVVVYPDGTERPGTSNVNFATDQTQANEVVTGVSVAKKAVVFVSSTGSTHLVVDLVGYFTRDSVSGASNLVALTPSRAFGAENERNSRGGTVTVDLASRLPSGATGAILNVTVAAPTAAGFVVVYPAGSSDPGTSNVNFGAKQVQANEVVTRLGTGSNAGKVTLRLSAGSARLIVDVVGAVVPTGTSGSAAFTPLASPKRVLDTRAGQGNVGASAGRRSAGQSVEVTLPSEVPADAKGVILNVTSTDQLGAGYVVVYPTGQSLPPTSNVNFVAKSNQANEVVVGVGTGRRVTLTVGGGGSPQTHLIADVVGYLK